MCVTEREQGVRRIRARFIRRACGGLSAFLLAALLQIQMAAADAAAARGPEYAAPVVPAVTEAVRERLREVFGHAIDSGWIVGGSILLIERGATVMQEGFGHADRAAGREFSAREVVNLASISKPFTATLLMLLVEAGHLDLDEPISTYLPEVGAIRLAASGEAVPAPTLRQLLSHTGGFLALGAGDGWRNLVYGPSTMAGAVQAIVDAGLDYRPGTGYAYTQLGYVVAAHAAERVMGKPFETLFQEWLARPLGAGSATFHPSLATIGAMPVRYARSAEGLRPLPLREFRAVGQPIDPAASLVADMEDVARLFSLHLHDGRTGERQLAQPSTIRAMHVPQPGTPGYGFGLNVNWDEEQGRARAVRHGGAFGTIAWADLEREVIGVMFTQTAWRQAPEWRRAFYQALDEVGLGAAARAGRSDEAGR